MRGLVWFTLIAVLVGLVRLHDAEQHPPVAPVPCALCSPAVAP